MQTRRSINLDRGWRFGTGSFNPMLDIVAQHFHAGDAPRIVDLPHDYMIESDVSADAPAGAASGFYTAGPAYYTRLVDIPAAWAGQEVFLQLDGAMMNATVEVNGSRAALQHNGYIPFAVRLTPYLTFGEENRITVNLNPSMQPNSRWYTGAGLFRSVRLVHCPKLHLAADGLFAWTRSLDWQDGAASLAHLQAEVDVCNETGEPRVAEVEVWLTPEAGGEAVARCAQVLQVNPGETAVAHLRFVLEKPALWQAGSPNLYRLHARVTEQGVFTTHLCPAEAPMTDEDSVLFGVRTVQVDPVHGLRINGRTTKLKGGCLHHDNAVAGAVSLYDLEVRKLQALQAIGFNAVRTAHNPPSAAFIEACDRLGLYVLDEAFDAWGMGKQPGDYNQFFDTDWQRDLAAFVRRDRAHPSVILWSTGNEIVERGGLGGGYPLAARLAEAVHALDPSRPVTNAICSYWNGTDDATAREIAAKILASGGGVLQNIQGDSAGDTDWERRSEAFTNGLDVVGYQDGREISRDALETTGAPAALRLTAEGALRADGHSVACVWAEVVDAAGRVVPNAAPALTAGLSGAGTLAGFGSANPITTDNYAAGRCQAYRGRALAVVRGGYETGSATLTVTAEGLPTASLTLAVAPAGGAGADGVG